MTGEPGALRVLLTGATGFVGRHLWPELVASGYFVRCLTRNARAARVRWPERDWFEADVLDETRVAEALRGCDAAFYLVHGMSPGRPDFRLRELRAAHRFAAAAAAAELERIVYLTCLPSAHPTEHVKSRQEVGDLLRRGPVPTLELRAGLIVGNGSVLWDALFRTVSRLPVLPVPAWAASRLQPVAIDDVVAGLGAALDVSLPISEGFDLGGPEMLPGQMLLLEAARAAGHRPLPLVRLRRDHMEGAARIVRWAANVDLPLARELIAQLAHDHVAHDDRYWHMVGHTRLLPVADAVHRAVLAGAARPWSPVETEPRRRARS